MASAEIADHVGFCSHHASRDLLHQAICKYSPENCFQPAVLEFLDFDRELDPKVRNGYQALNDILKRKAVVDEACWRFKEFIPPLKKKYESYQDKFQAALSKPMQAEYDRLMALQCQDPRNPTLDLHGFGLMDQSIQASDGLLYSAVAHHKKKKACKAREIPEMRLRATRYDPKDLDGSKKALNQILKKGHQSKIMIKGPHALVVSNYRIICIEGVETLQYQTLDSLYGTKWSSSKMPGDWIDGASLLKKLDRSDGFKWIEPGRGDWPPISFAFPETPGPPQVQGIIKGSPEYKAGLRNGLEYAGASAEENGKVIVWTRGPDGKKKRHEYVQSSP